ncbi:MAG TPA: PspC domain-containing protein [Burkholderiales bacterium]|jgi:phage shock protein PspC (stress-responsive transcriptional regulator)
MSTADDLTKLHQLLEKGALTQAEFDRAKARLLDESPGPGAGLAINRLRRSLADRWIAGVCGGIARITGMESWIWRMLFVLGLLFGGFTIFVYVVLWIFVPREDV